MIENKRERRPVIDPLLMVLKSRRVVVAVSAVLVGAMASAVPLLEPLEGELLTLVIALAFALIGGYTVEDAAHIGRETQPPDTLREAAREVMEALLTERLQDGDSEVKLPPAAE